MNSKQSWFQRFFWRRKYQNCLRLVRRVREMESSDFTAQEKLDDAGNALIAAAHTFRIRSEE
jgi:hypothetical protein